MSPTSKLAGYSSFAGAPAPQMAQCVAWNCMATGAPASGRDKANLPHRGEQSIDVKAVAMAQKSSEPVVSPAGSVTPQRTRRTPRP